MRASRQDSGVARSRGLAIVIGLWVVLLLWRLSPAIAAPADDSGASQPEGAPSSESTPPPVSGPRDLLKRYGIDESHFANLLDGSPLQAGEVETMLSVMFRLRECMVIDVEGWAREKLDLDQPVDDLLAARGEIFPLDGRIRSVEVLQPVPEMIDRVELEQYYRCELLLADGQPAVVYVPTVPKVWRKGGRPDERVRAFGLLLKVGSEGPRRPVPIFVAQRIAWYPETPLGELGMDVGLLDEARDKRAIARWERSRVERSRWDRTDWERAYWERECFYQMLSAVGRAQPGQLLREADQLLDETPAKEKRPDGEAFSVVPLFNDSSRQRGRLVVLSGVARRVERIRVQDADIRARFGIDHYYQLAVFTPDSRNNPIFFCVRRLPNGMPLTEDPKYREPVRVAGFFMKTWAYRTAEMSDPSDDNEASGPRRQVAPLLFAREPVWNPAEGGKFRLLSPTVELIAGGLFVVALLGICLGVWQYGRGDKRFHERTLARTHSVDSLDALNRIGEETDAGSDSSS